MSENNLKELKIKLISDPVELGKVRKQVESFAATLGLSEWCQTQIVLAVDESLTNIIRHAYSNMPDMPIELRIRHSDEILEIQIRDFGKNADPAEFKSRDIKDLRPGGLGVTIMKKCMDFVEYAPAPGCGTILTMRKDLTLPHDEPVSPHQSTKPRKEDKN